MILYIILFAALIIFFALMFFWTWKEDKWTEKALEEYWKDKTGKTKKPESKSGRPQIQEEERNAPEFSEVKFLLPSYLYRMRLAIIRYLRSKAKLPTKFEEVEEFLNFVEELIIKSEENKKEIERLKAQVSSLQSKV